MTLLEALDAWATLHSEDAAEKGWGLAEAPGFEDGSPQLWAHDEAETDEECWARLRADPDDAYLAALEILRQYNPAEYTRVVGS